MLEYVEVNCVLIGVSSVLIGVTSVLIGVTCVDRGHLCVHRGHLCVLIGVTCVLIHKLIEITCLLRQLLVLWVSGEGEGFLLSSRMGNYGAEETADFVYCIFPGPGMSWCLLKLKHLFMYLSSCFFTYYFI